MTNHTTGKFQSGDVGIFYRLFGQNQPNAGTPLVIVHGLSFFSYDWIEPASALSTDRQVAVIDMRGFGDSDWPGNYTVPAVAGDIVALLDHLGWKRAILLGHSMGGRHCTYCASENPERIAGLVLVDWSPENAPAGNKRVAEHVATTPETFPSVDEAMLFYKIDPASAKGKLARPRFEAYLKQVPDGFAIKRDLHFRNQFKRMIEIGERPKLGVDMWVALSRVACPILVIRGARSDMFAAETIPKVKEANARVHLIELNTGHNVAGDDLEGLVREPRGFFKTLSAQEASNG
jgi:pimeloyl-ACP methyl ester carboxylesterase